MAESIKGARKELASDLRPHLGKRYNVVDSAGVIDDPKRPTVAISHRRVRKLPAAPLGKLEHAFEALLVAPQSTTDDTLDDWLMDVLFALDVLRVPWTEAERGTFEQLYPCYRITLSTTSTRKAG